MCCRTGVRSWSSAVLVWEKDGDGAERALVTVRAASGIASSQAAKQVLPGFAMGPVGLWGCGCMEQLSCSCNEAGATAIGLKPEVPDTDEAAREDMQEESLDEVRRFEGEEPPVVAALSIAKAKGHATVLNAHQAFVADGNAVGVPA